MLCKKIKRTSTIDWCHEPKHKSFIASGTIEGILNEDFQSFSKLEIFDTRREERDHPLNMNPVVSINTSSSFQKLSWGPSLGSTTTMGVIAGGMSDGTIYIWNPLQLYPFSSNSLHKASDEFSFSSEERRASDEKVPIAVLSDVGFIPSCIEFNSGGLLAASSPSAGYIAIYDLNSLDYSTAFSTLDKSELVEQQVQRRALKAKLNLTVEALRWNRKVPHILASGSTNGSTCIWDLRLDKVVINIKGERDRGFNAPVSAISWNSAQALQLAIAYKSPIGEIWDLRNALAPKALLSNGHSEELVTVDWNPHDSMILITAGKEGRCCLWNTNGNLLSSFETEESPLFNLRWSPSMPSYLASSSSNGVSIRSVQYTGDDHAPEWLKKSASSSFSFRNRLLTFFNPPEKAPELIIRTISRGNHFGERARAFEKVLSTGRFKEFCLEMSEKSESSQEKTTWNFIRFLFEKDRKNGFITQLGFQCPKKEHPDDNSKSKPSRSTDKKDFNQPAVDALKLEEKFQQEEQLKDLQRKSVFSEPFVNEAEFFDQIVANGEDLEDSLVEPGESIYGERSRNKSEWVEERSNDKNNKASDGKESKESDKYSDGEDKEIEKNGEGSDFAKVKDCLIVGDFESAVEECIRTANFADALVVSSCLPNLWEKTQRTYLSNHRQSFLKNIFSLVMSNKMDDLVSKSDLVDWKQTLALILTYSSDDDCPRLCNMIAERLEKANMQYESVLCYLCALNIDKMTEKMLSGNQNDFDSLQSAVEKIFLCIFVTANKHNAKAECLLANYIKILFSYSEEELASRFLSHFYADIDSIQNHELKDMAAIINFRGKRENMRSTITRKEFDSTPSQNLPFSMPPKTKQSNINLQKPSLPIVSLNDSPKTHRNIPKYIKEEQNITNMPYSKSKGTDENLQVSEAVQPKTVSALKIRKNYIGQTRPVSGQNVSQVAFPLDEQQHKENFVSSPKPLPSQRLIQTPRQITTQKTFRNATQTIAPASAIKMEQSGIYNAISSQNIISQSADHSQPPSFSVATKSNLSSVPLSSLNRSHGRTEFRQSDNIGLREEFGIKNSNFDTTRSMIPTSVSESSSVKDGQKSLTAFAVEKPRIALEQKNLSERREQSEELGSKSINERTTDAETFSQLRPQYQQILQALLGILANIERKSLVGIEKRKAKDTFEKLDKLRLKMEKEEVSQAVMENLDLLVKDLEAKEFTEAKQRHVEMMTDNWNENKDWLAGINTLILLAKRHN